MFILREDFKNILVYYDYSRLCNVITNFFELSPDILKNWIILPLSKSKISIEWINSHINALNYYMDKINTNRYND